jgi:recombination protein RecA
MKNLKILVDEANKQFGDGTLILPEITGSTIGDVPEVISTGHKDIDDALGTGGLPFGRIVEVLGQEASGKTTLLLHIIANAQKKDYRCAFIDTEQALDRHRAELIGVDFEKLAISQPDNGEQALDLLDFLVRSNEFRVIVVDSVAALTPKAEIEGDMSDANIGVQARNMGKAMRKIVAPVNKQKILVIFTNQIRNSIGGFGYGPKETTPGGNALKFYASVRIDMRRTGNNKSGEKLLSTQHKVTIKKNKLAPPMKVASVKIGEKGFIQSDK